ncbi:polymer-forming cytoskeletal protein [Candidatus Palauibacter sp.]|uniref:polymer-forming cytoskeletal protein n=1 Tax=Candidatus Palauibacter sp. TaxID=3101350 RepID=UPI003B5264C5
MRRHAFAAALATGLAAFLAAPAQGQGVRLAGEPRSDAQAALQTFLEAGDFTAWTRDTVLARADTVPGSVLLLEGTARIAGRIEGDLYVVDGDLFLRSGASVTGSVLVLGGGFYDSDVAEIGGAITYRPNEPLRVRPTEGGFEIISEVEPEPAFELDGTYGFHLPTYDRVSGLSLPVGALARLSDAPGRPELAAGLTWIPAREDVDFRFHNSWRLAERLRLGLFATSAVISNEAWIRPTWYNSLAHFVAGDDVRGHYDSRQFGVELELMSAEPPVWEEAPNWRLIFTGGHEEGASLEAGAVTVLFGGEADDGQRVWAHPRSFWFARAGFEWSVNRRDGRTAFGVGVEGGLQDELGSDCNLICSYDFLLLEGRVSVRRVTAWGHAVDAFVIGRADVAGHLPSQRYSLIGGVGTLPTMPLRALSGPRLLYAETTYAIPLIGDAALGGMDVFARGSGAGIHSPRDDFELYGAIQGGVALRLWDFRLEFGAAAGSTAEPGDPGLIAFVDIRTRKSHRPTRMPPPR